MILGALPFLAVARVLACVVKEEDKRIVSIVESDSLPIANRQTQSEPIMENPPFVRNPTVKKTETIKNQILNQQELPKPIYHHRINENV